MYVALPIIAALVLLLLVLAFVCTRSQRRIGLGNVMGRRKLLRGRLNGIGGATKRSKNDRAARGDGADIPLTSDVDWRDGYYDDDEDRFGLKPRGAPKLA